MTDILARVRSWLIRWRVPLMAAGLVLFVGGLVIALRALRLELDDIRVMPIVLMLLVLAPLNLAVAGATLQLAARAVGRSIGFRDSVAVSATAAVAELLPLPGGGIVRGAALMRAGASLAASVRIVMVSSVLTLAMTALVAGLVLSPSLAGLILLGGGALGTGAAAGWLWWRAGAALAAGFVAVRLATLTLGAARLTAAFAALGSIVGVEESAVLVLATTLGSATSVVPAGLGVNELLASALAALIAIPPSAAFVAVALNRVLGLAVAGAVAGASGWTILRRERAS